MQHDLIFNDSRFVLLVSVHSSHCRCPCWDVVCPLDGVPWITLPRWVCVSEMRQSVRVCRREKGREREGERETERECVRRRERERVSWLQATS